MRMNVLLFGMIIATSTIAYGQPQLPEDQWTDETVQILAQALVSEADWSEVDHAAIVWVLYRRWKAQSKTDSAWTFKDQVVAYCSSMKGSLDTERKRWVRSLRVDGEEPDSWPSYVSWKAYEPRWKRVIRFVRAWSEGRISDPCQGQAEHWGGTMDHPGPLLRPVNCGPTYNIFYRVQRE